VTKKIHKFLSIALRLQLIEEHLKLSIAQSACGMSWVSGEVPPACDSDCAAG
jgi:hypothetical protein